MDVHANTYSSTVDTVYSTYSVLRNLTGSPLQNSVCLTMLQREIVHELSKKESYLKKHPCMVYVSTKLINSTIILAHQSSEKGH